MLEVSAGPLAETHDLLMFDLDGVVHINGRAIQGVAEHIHRLRTRGAHVAFVTNNASRTPVQVAEAMARAGVPAETTEIVTSAQAAARILVEAHGVGAKVVLLGGEGLKEALLEEGLVPDSDPQGAVAVVSGYGPDVRWKDVMRVAALVRDGLPYVGCNGDLTTPMPYGLAPGHGALAGVIGRFAGVEPVIAGKPERSLMEETVRRVGGQRALMVGDRLDTDIAGAHAIGASSLLVLTGVTQLMELAAATPGRRPMYISPDTSGLFEDHRVPVVCDGLVSLGGWTGRVASGTLCIDGTGSEADWWRVAATAAWSRLDATGVPVDVPATYSPGTPLGGL